jgi:septum formation protein
MLLLDRVVPSVTHRPVHPLRRSSAPHEPGRWPRVLLASKSPRRRLMLEQAGIEHEVVESGVDDAHLSAGSVGAEQWVIALAYLKAAAALTRLGDRRRVVPSEHGKGGEVVLGADTVVVDDGLIIGQPTDRADAERILRRLSNGEHDVLTGVAILDVDSGHRDLFADRAHVTVGPLSDEQINSYLDSGQWRGKAGAYNLAERLQAGWPIKVEGDPGTVMGLPMQSLTSKLAAFGG